MSRKAQDRVEPAPKEGRQAAKGKTADLDKLLARALSHPLRTEILRHLVDKPAAPSELVPILEAELSNVSYHFRQLLAYECIEPVKSERIRGAVKTWYRATTRMILSDQNWRKLNRSTRDGISVNAVNEAIELAKCAMEHGTFDNRIDRHVINLKMEVDEKGWSEVAAIVAAAYHRLMRVEAEAVNRTPEAEERFRATICLLSFESPRKGC